MLTLQQAADIIQIILDHGKLRPPDILSKLGIFEPKSNLFDFRKEHSY